MTLYRQYVLLLRFGQIGHRSPPFGQSRVDAGRAHRERDAALVVPVSATGGTAGLVVVGVGRGEVARGGIAGPDADQPGGEVPGGGAGSGDEEAAVGDRPRDGSGADSLATEGSALAHLAKAGRALDPDEPAPPG